MTLIKLPEKAGFALRHAPFEQQRAFLAVIAHWPSNVRQSTQAYSEQLKAKISQIVAVWGGVWLNPEEGNQKLKLQCAQGHLINTCPFYLRQGVWCTGCSVESLRDSLHSMQALAAKCKGVCLSSEYINWRSKLLWQCEQGHIWEATSDFVKAGNWCSICYLQHKNANDLNKMKCIAEQHGGEYCRESCHGILLISPHGLMIFQKDRLFMRDTHLCHKRPRNWKVLLFMISIIALKHCLLRMTRLSGGIRGTMLNLSIFGITF